MSSGTLREGGYLGEWRQAGGTLKQGLSHDFVAMGSHCEWKNDKNWALGMESKEERAMKKV